MNNTDKKIMDKLKQRMLQVTDIKETSEISKLVLKVSPEIRKQRYDICQSCEYLFKPTNSCKKCGCFMGVKTWMPKQSCPLKKWDAVTE